MNFTKEFSDLRSIYDSNINEITIPESDIRIVNLEFISETNPEGLINSEDLLISENRNFRYPVFIPRDNRSRKVIILLHGLNERSWAKYLPWAYYLSVHTDSYVVMFPICFHINRSPSSWIDPRVMTDSVKERTSTCSDVKMSSFANIALSNRLSDDPMRFFHSGYQTAFDIVNLLNQIKHGHHGVIPKGSSINMFAYSIGAFLAQILFMGNPDNLFSDSKLFMFCGGSVFSTMKGTSKLIMDSVAYNKIYNFYLEEFETEIKKKKSIYWKVTESPIGMAFRSMIGFDRFRSFREILLGRLKDQIRSIALLRDAVIPAEGIVKTMQNFSRAGRNVEVWDFPYSYSHENPFPLTGNHPEMNPDPWFNRLFREASLFLV